MERCILHADCNSFFASVECVYRPALWRVPMAVCGDPENRHGIVLAKNEKAKACGIVTAETVWQARRKCPELVLVPPHFERYREFSKRINAIYCEYTDRVEPFSIDESWLDVTGSERLFGNGKTIADTLRHRIKNELGITVSVGVSFNKTFAKMGSDYRKPDATTVLSKDTYRSLLYPLPISRFLFVGQAAEQALNRIGIYTVGDLAAADRQCLVALLGKSGGQLVDYANGRDFSPVRLFTDHEEAKSIGNGMTFHHDLTEKETLLQGLLYLSDPVVSKLRASGRQCRTVRLSLKYPSLKTASFQRRLARPTALLSEFYAEAAALLNENWKAGTPVRSLTVTACQLETPDAAEQLSLFAVQNTAAREQAEKLETAVDSLRKRFGEPAVKRCSVLKGAPDAGNSGLPEEDFEKSGDF